MNRLVKWISVLLIAIMFAGILPADYYAEAEDNIIYYHAEIKTGGSYILDDSVDLRMAFNKKEKTVEMYLERTEIIPKSDSLFEERIESNKRGGWITDEEAAEIIKERSRYSSHKESWGTAKFTVDKEKGKIFFSKVKWSDSSFPLSLQFGGVGGEHKTITIGSVKDICLSFTPSSSKTAYLETMLYLSSLVFDGTSRGLLYTTRNKIPEQPKKEEKKYEILKDNFSFVNKRSSFFSRSSGENAGMTTVHQTSYAAGTVGSLINNEIYENLEKSMKSESLLAALNRELSNDWIGCCMGMTAVSDLIYEGGISLKKVGGAKTAFELKKPTENEALARQIIYYQILGNVMKLSEIGDGEYSAALSASKLKKKVESELPKNPFIITFQFFKDGKTSGHAVLAFDWKKPDAERRAKGDEMDILVYDPNYPNEARHIYLSTANNAVTSPGYAGFTVTNTLHGSQLAKNAAKLPDIPEDRLLVISEGDVTLTENDKSAVIKDGKVKKNNGMDVTVFNGEDGSSQIIILINGVKPKDKFTAKTKGDDANIALMRKNQFINADGKGEVSVSLNGNGSVTAKTGNKKAEGSLSVANDKNKTGSGNIEVKANGGQIDITPTSTGAKVKTKSKKTTITTTGTGRRTKSYRNINAVKTVTVSTKDGNTVIKSKDKVLAGGDGSSSKDDSSKNDSSKNNGDLPVDKTGYTPKNWTFYSGGAVNEKFKAGKYVREDGYSVLYVNRTDDADRIEFRIYLGERVSDGVAFEAYMIPNTKEESNITGYHYKGEPDNYYSNSLYDIYMTADGDRITVDVKEAYPDDIFPGGVYVLVEEAKPQ